MDWRYKMTTRNELLTKYKKDYPTLTVGSDDNLTEVTADEYERIINEWVDNALIQSQLQAELEAKEVAKAVAQAKLEALGLTTDDLKALGL